MSERDSLSSRKLPSMTLSDGSTTSKTAPPPALPQAATASEKALARFGVTGDAVITGGAGTLALSAARAILEHGASGLSLLDLESTFASSAQAISELRSDFPSARIETIVADVTDATAVDHAFSRAASSLSCITTCLCFAGIVSCVHALEMTPEQWRKTLDVNTTGAFLCAQAAARRMMEHGKGGSVMLVASISGHRVNFPQPQVAYNVSKAALIAMKNSLAAEWAVHGIRVNSISPGYQNTVLNEGDFLESERNIWASRCPMGRMGEVGELDGAIVMLSSRAGSYITGADLVIDGGQTLF